MPQRNLEEPNLVRANTQSASVFSEADSFCGPPTRAARVGSSIYLFKPPPVEPFRDGFEGVLPPKPGVGDPRPLPVPCESPV